MVRWHGGQCECEVVCGQARTSKDEQGQAKTSKDKAPLSPPRAVGRRGMGNECGLQTRGEVASGQWPVRRGGPRPSGCCLGVSRYKKKRNTHKNKGLVSCCCVGFSSSCTARRQDAKAAPRGPFLPTATEARSRFALFVGVIFPLDLSPPVLSKRAKRSERSARGGAVIRNAGTRALSVGAI